MGREELPIEEIDQLPVALTRWDRSVTATVAFRYPVTYEIHHDGATETRTVDDIQRWMDDRMGTRSRIDTRGESCFQRPAFDVRAPVGEPRMTLMGGTIADPLMNIECRTRNAECRSRRHSTSSLLVQCSLHCYSLPAYSLLPSNARSSSASMSCAPAMVWSNSSAFRTDASAPSKSPTWLSERAR